jgi:hypothetical protein
LTPSIGWRPVLAAAAGLLHHEADRVGLVEQAQAARLGRVLGVARVQEDAAAHQDAVRLGHHAGDPAHVEVLAARAGAAGQAFVDVALDRRLPEAAVAAVDGELLRVLGHRMFGCVSTNSPRFGFSVKPATPLPTVSTSIVVGP